MLLFSFDSTIFKIFNKGRRHENEKQKIPCHFKILKIHSLLFLQKTKWNRSVRNNFLFAVDIHFRIDFYSKLRGSDSLQIQRKSVLTYQKTCGNLGKEVWIIILVIFFSALHRNYHRGKKTKTKLKLFPYFKKKL